MYPYELFWGLDLYQLMIILAFLAALIHFRILADRAGLSVRVQKLTVFSGLMGVLSGYGFAVLFQAAYNAMESGKFVIDGNTGATFYGGFIGGVGVFFLVYWIGTLAARRKKPLPKALSRISNIAIGSVTIGHGIGRIGCLFAGCCHGRVTEAWYGVYNVSLHAKTVPVQLFEALFLFALGAFMTWNELRGKRRNNLGYYGVGYGAWRFFIEFFRADERGQTIVPFLTPSQLIAVLMMIAGMVLLVHSFRTGRKEETV